MRSFEKKNIRSFTIFGIFVALAIAALTFVVYSSLSSKNNTFDVVTGSIIYTDKDEVIEVSNDCQIIKKWDKNYYLNENGDSENLGKNPIVYSSNKGTLDLLGDTYHIYPDGTTTKSSNINQITSFNESTIYKLADRKYVIVGKEITSFDGSVNAKNFVRVSIDRNGNALLQSSGINNKTINPIILISGEVYFDIASELLYSNGVETNMRKVIGSTNEYSNSPVLYNNTGIERPVTSTANERVPDIEEYNISAGAGGTGGTGGYGGDGGFGGSGGLGGTGGTGADGGNGGQGGKAADPKEDTTFYVGLKNVTAGVKSLTVNYEVYDQSNALSKVIIRLREDNNYNATYKQYVVTKYNTSYKIYSLDENKKYNVEIGYVPYIPGDTNGDGEKDKWVNGDYVAVANATVKTETKFANVDIVKVYSNIIDGKVTSTAIKFNLAVEGYNFDFDNYNYYINFEFYNKNLLLKTKSILIGENAQLSSGQNIMFDGDDNVKGYNKIIARNILSDKGGVKATEIEINKYFDVNNSIPVGIYLTGYGDENGYVTIMLEDFEYDDDYNNKIYVDLLDINSQTIDTMTFDVESSIISKDGQIIVVPRNHGVDIATGIKIVKIEYALNEVPTELEINKKIEFSSN